MTDHSPEHRLDPIALARGTRDKKPLRGTTREAAEDLRQRWLPSPEQTTQALAALETIPATTRDEWVAVVPLAQPGKVYGFWEIGQPVVCLPGVWLGHNSATATTHPLHEARDEAEQRAHQWLLDNDLPGTVAVAYVHPDGNAAVFEGLRPSPEAP